MSSAQTRSARRLYPRLVSLSQQHGAGKAWRHHTPEPNHTNKDTTREHCLPLTLHHDLEEAGDLGVQLDCKEERGRGGQPSSSVPGYGQLESKRDGAQDTPHGTGAGWHRLPLPSPNP